MKINFGTKQRKLITFDELKIGDLFLDEDDLCIKIDGDAPHSSFFEAGDSLGS